MRKPIKTFLAIFLCAACLLQPCSALAASSSKKTYVKETILSYGKTADEAKKWLTDNGYAVLDYDLNEGADDTFSTKRAVYLGYTTTENADEAITDMRLMNMKGGYSVQDYEILLDEQKTNIKAFLNDFKVAVGEFRTNYEKGQERAKAAYAMLNVMYEDDTQQFMGDLLLNRIREEYTDEEYAALSDEVKKSTVDMTTVLMQANSDAVLAIEQTIATATDSGGTLWTERYADAPSYDDMVDELMNEKKLSVNDAEKQLALEYDDDAKAIVSKFEEYKTYLANYTKEEITLASAIDEIKAYEEANPDFSYANWFAAGTQYELLDTLENDGITLLELITGDDFDVESADRYMLYPLVSCLTDGQRACLNFLSMYNIVALGINGDEATKEAIEDFPMVSNNEGKQNSVYDGVDRMIFSNDVALTNEAIRLRTSTGKEPVSSAASYISATSYLLYGVFCLTLGCTVAAWRQVSALSTIAAEIKDNISYLDLKSAQMMEKIESFGLEEEWGPYQKKYNEMIQQSQAARDGLGQTNTWMKYFRYAGIAMTCLSIVLIGVSLWNTYNDLKEYYNAEFTPIPAYMVDESTDENDEKVYTYYTAVKCNRADAGMTTKKSSLLKDFGDINGDVGRQWVALYTTKDKAAGYPILADMLVRYENSNIPEDKTAALSMFGENYAQNLTNENAGYTYDDDKDGIYMFYSCDSSAFSASVISYGIAALAGGCVAAAAAAVFFTIRKKKNKTNQKEFNVC